MSFAEVREARRSRFGVWHPPQERPDSAKARLDSGDYVAVWNAPKFTFCRNSRVFTIGSCFARHIEHALIRAGVAVVTHEFALPIELYAQSRAGPNAVLDKYNTHSILSELSQALEPELLEDDGLVELAPGEWWDPLSSHLAPAPFEVASSTRRSIRALTARVVECDLVIVTLGLNEVWLDTETGVFVNQHPPLPALRRYPERFAVLIAGYEDNLSALESALALLRTHAPGIKAVFTVSPVPMFQTLSGKDVFAANTYSKSILRVCAQRLADSYDDVDYFPSYEMAMNSPRELTWQSDWAHVTDETVEFITRRFVESYLSDDS